MSDFKRRREVELKHGRVAMFATIGYIVPEYWRFPGYLSKFLDIKFSEVPNGLSAFSKVPALGWLQIVGFAGIVELNVARRAMSWRLREALATVVTHRWI
eukprot:Skav223473  [mRNA]  locus=scaffold2550:129110:134288:+ [translate_table: standard]